MRLPELVHSTHVRFALILTTAFLAALVVAGYFALRAINADLDARIVQRTELTIAKLEDLHQSAGRKKLAEEVALRSDSMDREDEQLWLGTLNGEFLAGSPLTSPMHLTTGVVMGDRIAAEHDDRYRVIVRDLDDARLIYILSFEEAEAIGGAVLTAFAWATGALILFGSFSAIVLALRGQARIDLIKRTLHSVSAGDVKSRIPVSRSNDDLNRLAIDVNAALEQLELTVEGIRQVGANIAHDLRTPVNRLGIHLEHLLSEHPGPSDLHDRLKHAAAESRQISATFDALLRISQIEAGARKARFQRVSLTDIARSVHEAYGPVAEDHHQQLKLSTATREAAFARGDKELLTQALANLTENALQHCPPGSTIILEVGEGGHGGWLSVSDNGPGIPAAEQENVLKRFYRIDRARQTPGSGLGLALVKAISDLHSATLSLRDNKPGLGVRLSFNKLTSGG